MGAHCDAIVTAVTDLCETLGMVTLAEGVETEEQLEHLRTGNCGEAQGYLFSRPRPASEVTAMCTRLQLGFGHFRAAVGPESLVIEPGTFG